MSLAGAPCTILVLGALCLACQRKVVLLRKPIKKERTVAQDVAKEWILEYSILGAATMDFGAAYCETESEAESQFKEFKNKHPNCKLTGVLKSPRGETRLL